MTKNFVFEADMAAKKIYVSREFNAPLEKVWRAFTEPELLKKWAAPKPWRIEEQTWDFTVGGASKYVMINPEGARHWVYDQFTAIENGRFFSTIGVFCDHEGTPNLDGSKSYTETRFFAIDGNRTKIETVHTFDNENTVKWFVDGGFKEGTAATLNQLDEVLASE
ncbi:MAG: SRPBCC domain-containing protein [Bacteroidetes bacterium]|nr:SRPBCC domain-containing protein [Bacteroidota bacterium]